MKKIGILIFIGIAIIASISYIYLNYKANFNIAQKENKQLETYYNQEIYGSDLATVINKAIDSNITNNIEKDDKGKYLENDTNSIKIDIHFTDDDKIHTMEEIYYSGIEKFIGYYNKIKFKCTQINYHQSTNKIKYMLFEQITQ